MSDCDCEIDAERDADQTKWRIEYCPMHKAAPDLLKALEALLKALEPELTGPPKCSIVRRRVAR